MKYVVLLNNQPLKTTDSEDEAAEVFTQATGNILRGDYLELRENKDGISRRVSFIEG